MCEKIRVSTIRKKFFKKDEKCSVDIILYHIISYNKKVMRKEMNLKIRLSYKMGLYPQSQKYTPNLICPSELMLIC